MIVKIFQFLGLLFPVFVIAVGEYLFKDISPERPLYSGAAVTMGFVGIIALAFMIYAVTVIPTSLILLKKKNREYFRFQSIGWRAVMLFNWALIVFCGLFVMISALFGFIKTLL
ncbi:hypothetical protein [Aliiglaciecola sp. LCG003]|uniref:hypothetical protein n=1 Tax=Aliiglaciecola sp. LCG003 TaxID=3053655 RepID=UPI0025735023|nr:hypothetical protein [Aliiglaciecola sp. LCG003]WJG10927.1 hypothetical protein QR722_07845 [Aliiglaciecola sp. LCG003]